MLLIKCSYLILFNHILYKLLKLCSALSSVLVYICSTTFNLDMSYTIV